MIDRDTIVKLAREAGIHVYPEFESAFERFAALVAAAEREACAKVCESLRGWSTEYEGYCEDAIRARG